MVRCHVSSYRQALNSTERISLTFINVRATAAIVEISDHFQLSK